MLFLKKYQPPIQNKNERLTLIRAATGGGALKVVTDKPGNVSGFLSSGQGFGLLWITTHLTIILLAEQTPTDSLYR